MKILLFNKNWKELSIKNMGERANVLFDLINVWFYYVFIFIAPINELSILILYVNRVRVIGLTKFNAET